MRRKFTFYAYGSDIGDIIRQVRSVNAVFVSVRSESPEPRLLGEADLTPGSQVLIAPKALVADLIPQDPAGRGVWILSESQDPVIELIISRIKDDLLHSGRLYFLPQAVDQQRMEFVDKPEQVRVLADVLFAWARRWTKRAGGHSCGPEAARAVRDGRLRLADTAWSPEGFKSTRTPEALTGRSASGALPRTRELLTDQDETLTDGSDPRHPSRHCPRKAHMKIRSTDILPDHHL